MKPGRTVHSLLREWNGINEAMRSTGLVLKDALVDGVVDDQEQEVLDALLALEAQSKRLRDTLLVLAYSEGEIVWSYNPGGKVS